MFVELQEVIFMTGTTVLRFILETLAVLAIGYCIYHEAEINRFERKAIRFLKRAKRIIMAEIRENKEMKREAKADNIIEFKAKEDTEAQYEYLLNRVS